MPQYTYQARNGSGSVEAGALAASDAATAAAMLRGKGLHVVQLAPTATQDRFSGPVLGTGSGDRFWGPVLGTSSGDRF